MADLHHAGDIGLRPIAVAWSTFGGAFRSAVGRHLPALVSFAAGAIFIGLWIIAEVGRGLTGIVAISLLGVAMMLAGLSPAAGFLVIILVLSLRFADAIPALSSTEWPAYFGILFVVLLAGGRSAYLKQVPPWAPSLGGRRTVIVIVSTVAGAATAAVVLAVVPPTFEASAVLAVRSDALRPTASAAGPAPLPTGSGIDTSSYWILEARTSLSAEAADNVGIPIETFSNAVSIEPFDGESVLANHPFFTIEARSASPEEAVALATELTTLLIEQSQYASDENPIFTIEVLRDAATLPPTVAPGRIESVFIGAIIGLTLGVAAVFLRKVKPRLTGHRSRLAT